MLGQYMHVTSIYHVEIHRDTFEILLETESYRMVKISIHDNHTGIVMWHQLACDIHIYIAAHL